MAKSLGESGAGKMPTPKRSAKISQTLYCHDYSLPTSNILIKRGKKGNSTYSISASTPYSPIIGCILACTTVEPQNHAAKTQDTPVNAVENTEFAEIKCAVFRAPTRLRAATIKEFDTTAQFVTQAIDAYCKDMLKANRSNPKAFNMSHKMDVLTHLPVWRRALTAAALAGEAGHDHQRLTGIRAALQRGDLR